MKKYFTIKIVIIMLFVTFLCDNQSTNTKIAPEKRMDASDNEQGINKP